MENGSWRVYHDPSFALHATGEVDSVSRGAGSRFCPTSTWNVRAIFTKSAQSGLEICIIDQEIVLCLADYLQNRLNR